jgi:hypothetical protein
MTRWFILVGLIFLLLGSGTCEVTKIYATQDVYFSLQSEKVSRNDTILRCEVNVTGVGSQNVTYPGVPMVQFNISGLNLSDDDIGVLVLKAESMKKTDASGMVAVVPVGSDWDESSEFLELALNLLPLWKSMKSNELAGQIGIDSDDDMIFAYDVSGKLKETKEDRISFFLEAVSNNSIRVDFKSRESGEGPYLMIIPYPSVLKIDLTKNQTLNQSQSTTLSQELNLNKRVNQSTIQVPENAINGSAIDDEAASASDTPVIKQEEMKPSSLQKQGEAKALSLISGISAL